MQLTHERVGQLAALVRSEHLDRGLLARVRRFVPQAAAGLASFEVQSLLLMAGIDPDDAPSYANWSLAAHCLALSEGRHDANVATGGRLGELWSFSELRLRVLAEADRALLFDLLPRLARHTAGQGLALNWWSLLALVFLQPAEAEKQRRHLIAGFLRAQARSRAVH